ncbi:MAG: ABC transporter permease [Breznakibacter sp.]
MNYSNLLKISGSALLRNKMRALLTMLGIIIGVASVIAMLGIGQGSKQSIRDQMSSMGTNLVFVMPGSQQRGGVQMGSSNMQSLKLADMEAIKLNSPHVAKISPEVRSSGQVVTGNKNWPSTIYGGNTDYMDIKKFSVANGRIFTEKEVRTMAKVCIVGQTVIDNLFEKGVDPIGQTIRFKNIPFKIIGVMAEKGENSFGQDQDDMIIAPYTTVQRRVLAIELYPGHLYIGHLGGRKLFGHF